MTMSIEWKEEQDRGIWDLRMEERRRNDSDKRMGWDGLSDRRGWIGCLRLSKPGAPPLHLMDGNRDVHDTK